jgi:hypothetical protein
MDYSEEFSAKDLEQMEAGRLRTAELNAQAKAAVTENQRVTVNPISEQMASAFESRFQALADEECRCLGSTSDRRLRAYGRPSASAGQVSKCCPY